MDPVRRGAVGLPALRQGKLFQGFLTLAKRCNVCGLDYSFADPADGPAFFVMMLDGHSGDRHRPLDRADL